MDYSSLFLYIETFCTLVGNNIKEMESKPKFEIVLHRDARDFLNRMDEKSSRKIKENMYKASLCMDPVLLKKLTGDIW